MCGRMILMLNVSVLSTPPGMCVYECVCVYGFVCLCVCVCVWACSVMLPVDASSAGCY